MIGGFIVFSTCVIIIAVIGVLILNAAKKDHSKFEVKKKKEPVQQTETDDSNWSAGEDRWDPFPTRPNMTVVMLDEESGLEEELERAIDDEDYLLAAAIRDELKTIRESKNKKQKLQA